MIFTQRFTQVQREGGKEIPVQRQLTSLSICRTESSTWWNLWIEWNFHLDPLESPGAEMDHMKNFLAYMLQRFKKQKVAKLFYFDLMKDRIRIKYECLKIQCTSSHSRFKNTSAATPASNIMNKKTKNMYCNHLSSTKYLMS